LITSEIQKDFKVAQETIVLLTSFYTGFLFLSGPIVAGLANAFGIRAVAVGGGTVLALMLAASAYSPNIILMLICHGIIGGIATGCLYISALIITSQYFDKKMGIAMGICMSGSGFGAFALAPIITFLIEKLKWKVN